MSIIFKTTKGNVENKNLELVYDMFNFNRSSAIEFKVEDGKSNYKTLWKNNCKDVGLYVNNKLKSILFSDLQTAYQYLLKNKDKLYSADSNVEVKYEKGQKSLCKYSLIELDAIIELMNLLKKKNIITKKVKAIKSNIDLKPVDSFQNERFNKISNAVTNKGIIKREKEFFVKISFSNSNIIEYANNKSDYEESRKLYNTCKEKYAFEKIQLIKTLNGVETVLYSKDNTSNRQSQNQLNLLDSLNKICEKITISKKSLKNQSSVLDKKINIIEHEIENTTFTDDLNQYKLVVDRIKMLLDERRDIKKAIFINDMAFIKIKDVDFNDYNKACKIIKNYEQGASDYTEGKVDVKTYQYKNQEEYKKLVSHFSKETVRDNPEKQEIYVYKKHFK